MGEILAGILEMLGSIAAVTGCGTPRSPAPGFLRFAVRGVGLRRAIAAVLALAWKTELRNPTFVSVGWLLCGMSALLAEHELGRGWIALPAWGLATALLVSALWAS